jgi:hypothetical protein
MLINLMDKHIKLCKEYASFRRTLNQAIKLLDEGMDAHIEEVHLCVKELEAITPTIEALQFAVREGV